MLEITELLIERHDICIFRGSDRHLLDPFRVGVIQERYYEAFKYPDKKVAIVVSDPAEPYYVVVDDFDQFWRNRHRITHDIEAVLRMPPEVWEKFEEKIDSKRIIDLTMNQAAA